MRTKIAKLIMTFIALLDAATEQREVYKQKRLAFIALEKAEKRMSFQSVCELNIAIYEAMDKANARINNCNQFAIIYSRGIRHA